MTEIWEFQQVKRRKRSPEPDLSRRDTWVDSSPVRSRRRWMVMYMFSSSSSCSHSEQDTYLHLHEGTDDAAACFREMTGSQQLIQRQWNNSRKYRDTSTPTWGLEIECDQLGATEPHGQRVVVGRVQPLSSGRTVPSGKRLPEIYFAVTRVTPTRASAFCVASRILATQLVTSSRLSAATSSV
ncbi:hypothetical protein EYF80_029865 [Liparis tanakae]|uniref:Uncharacterized protein n=1 Tax=Liparis tanakae TaxID=230148 RepID=A0A4Z2H2A1_9TELE|nr:hypothetical protein EYF80_029865 [Liparis tanakae]